MATLLNPALTPTPAPKAPPAAKPSKRRLYFWVAAALIAAAGGSYFYRNALNLASPAAAIRTATVRAGSIEQIIRLTGQTSGDGAVIRAPWVRGSRNRSGGAGDFRLILETLTRPGQRVRSGDIVAAFDRQYMLNRLDNVRVDRVELEPGLKRLRSTLNVRRAALGQALLAAKAARDKAVLDLRTAPVRSDIQVELFNIALAEAEAIYQARLRDARQQELADAAEFRIQQLELEDEILDERQAKSAADLMIVRSPMNGIAVVHDVYRAGELVQIVAGDELRFGQPFLQIVDPDSIMVEAAANQVDVGRLRTGAPVALSFDAYPDLTVPGKLHSISPVVQRAGRRRGFTGQAAVVITFQRNDERIIPSMSVGADVVVGEEANTRIVPREAVFYDNDGRPYVWIRTAKGWDKREIELGLQNNVAASVRSGVAPGDVVAAGSAPEPNQNTD